MSNYEFLKKVEFDGVSYITPTGIEEMLVNPLDYQAFYQYVIRKYDLALNNKKPFRLVFLNGKEKVTLYKSLIDRYEVKLDPSVEKTVSIGYIYPWLSPLYFDWIYFFNRFTKTIKRTTNLYGFFKVVEHIYVDQRNNKHSNFYLQATDNAYVEGVSVDKNFCCKLINVAESPNEMIDFPLSSFAYNVPNGEYFGRLFFKESDIFEELKNQGILFNKLPADESVRDMVSIFNDSHELSNDPTNDFNSEKNEHKLDKPASKATLKLIGMFLAETVYNDKKFDKQSDIVNYLCNMSAKRKSKNGISGFSEDNLERIFSEARKVILDDIPDLKTDDNKLSRLTDAIDKENE